LITIVVSDRHLSASCQFEIPGKEIVLLPDEAIAAQANAVGDFPYFALSEVSLVDDEAIIALQLSWAVSDSSKQASYI